MTRAEYPSSIEPDSAEQIEILIPGHFYAAYVFDKPETRESDIRQVIEEAQRLNYRMRYWWLSDAMDVEGFPDRLILCIHHPSSSEEAGMDLYNALIKKEVLWDDLEAAALDEYRDFGRSVSDLAGIRVKSGRPLFPTGE